MNVMSSGGPKERDIISKIIAVTRSWQAKGSTKLMDQSSPNYAVYALHGHECTEMAQSCYLDRKRSSTLSVTYLVSELQRLI